MWNPMTSTLFPKKGSSLLRFYTQNLISKTGLLASKSLIILLISNNRWDVLQYEIVKNPMGLIEFTLNQGEKVTAEAAAMVF